MGRRRNQEDFEPIPLRREKKKRVRLIPLLLMLIGACTVFVMVARYVVVPLLVWAGGQI